MFEPKMFCYHPVPSYHLSILFLGLSRKPVATPQIHLGHQKVTFRRKCRFKAMNRLLSINYTKYTVRDSISWYRVSIGLVCLYILEEVEIWSGDTDA